MESRASFLGGTRRRSLRWFALPLLPVACCGLAASASAELLATFADHAQGSDTGHAYFDVADVDLVIGDSIARLFDAASIGPTPTPVLFEATAENDPEFAAVAALLTNGEPDEFVIELTGASGGGIGLGSNDCALFSGDYDCIVGADLQGGRIDRITLEVRELALTPVDPVGTEIFFDVSLQIFGAPEPAASLLGLVAVAALAAARALRSAALSYFACGSGRCSVFRYSRIARISPRAASSGSAPCTIDWPSQRPQIGICRVPCAGGTNWPSTKRVISASGKAPPLRAAIVVRSAGAVRRIPPKGPSPRPELPWQTAQCCT